MKKKKNANAAAPARNGTGVTGEGTPLRTALVLLAAVTLIGTWFRFANISYLSFWGDELNHVFAAKSIIEQGEPLLPSGQPYNRAYFFTYATSLMDRIWGVGEVSNRALPAVFGVMSVPLLFLLGLFFYGDRRRALVAATFIAVIPWYIVRARIVRMYTLFLLLYLVFAVLFYIGLEWRDNRVGAWVRERFPKTDAGYLRFAVPAAVVGCSLAVLAFSVKIMNFAFEAGPTVMVYAAVLLAAAVRRDGVKNALRSKYGVLVLLSVAGALLAPVIIGVFGFVPFRNLIPSWEYLLNRWQTEPFWALEEYSVNTLYHLHPWVWIPGVAGIVLALRRIDRKRLYVAVMFLVPFLMQSLIFNNPGAVKAQYVFFAFPFFLLMAADAVVWASDRAGASLLRNRGASPAWLMPTMLTVVFAAVPLKEAYSAVTEKKHGDIKDYSAERYANWRDACAFVAGHRQDGDAVMSTQPWSVLYYMDDADYYVRMGFNDKMMLREGYRTNYAFKRTDDVPPVRPLRDIYSGARLLRDYNSFLWTLAARPRGWLIGCHKLFNPAFVDKRALDFINKRMKRVYVDRDRSVVVYHWNFGGAPAPRYRVAPDSSAAHPFNLPDPRQLPGELRLQVDVSGMDAAEAAVSFNGRRLELRAGTDGERQVAEAVLPRALLRAGRNEAAFTCPDGHDGYRIFNIGLTLKRGKTDYSIM